MNFSIRLAILATAIFIMPADLSAEEGHGEHSGGHEFHKNVLAGVIGISAETRRENALTLGIEYERRLSPSLGLGLVVERAFGDLDFTVALAPLAFHSGPWVFYAGPGVEDSDAHGTQFLMRFGGGYTFDMGSYEIIPQLDIDFVSGDNVIVLGVAIGKGF